MKKTIEVKTDAHLQRDVLDELEWEPSVDAAQIGVTARDSVVTLTGHVPVYSLKHTAEEVAKRVHGVRAVANEIEVRPSDTQVRDDAEIAAAAVHALQWDSEVPESGLRLSVEDGWIKVSGAVEHRYQKAAVDRVLRHLRGVQRITNDVGVAPPQATSGIKETIESAFRRSAMLNARALTVEVEDSTVTITGDVHSLSELAEVERTAWSAGGVHTVQNCVTITPWGAGPAEEWGY
ncbi:periplasmic protein [Stieleria maiorica]|uniref:Periplasmic protein n=1 Tax=Stieleria maiorica TaxID=2795974 RepID=A0A5B9MN43_9BACT|nr:BON domain-containing protein [Stieleria maiorica]QEG00278.1 periplasmic protein [Stieleria maiorica]